MDLDTTEGYFSDEEIFIGKLTLEEVRKRLVPVGCTPTADFKYPTHFKEDGDKSFELIEAHSAPSLVCNSLDSPGSTESEYSPSLIAKASMQEQPDDSFLQMEKLVTEICATNEPVVNEVLYNTPAIKKYIQNSKLQELKNDLNFNIHITSNEETSVVDKVAQKQPEETSIETKTPKIIKTRQAVKTPNNLDQGDIFSTPGSELKTKSPIFKTPLMPVSQKKLYHTPAKYQHVVSPVATYIKQSPVVPLMKDVCAKRALHGISSIPKPVKHSSGNKENCRIKQTPIKQENAMLPSVAYRSAKETKVIDVPDEGKLPQSQWAKQVASSIPRALVLSHNSRQINSAKPVKTTEDSFDNLTLHQADLSVCVQKSALTKLNKRH